MQTEGTERFSSTGFLGPSNLHKRAKEICLSSGGRMFTLTFGLKKCAKLLRKNIETHGSPRKPRYLYGQRTIGSIKSDVLAYLGEERNQKFKKNLSGALSASSFVPHSKSKVIPFEAYHRKEANSLSKKPSLKNFDWANV